MDQKERRAHSRKLVSTGVAFHDLEGAPLRGWLHDISRGGCFIATPSLFTYGEEIDFSLTLPYPRVVVAGKARVIWVREKNDRDMPAGMGVQFVDVKDDAIAAIEKVASAAKLSRPKTVIGIAPPAAGSSPSYSDVQIPPPKIEMKPEPEPLAVAETVPAPAAETVQIAPVRKKPGREKWLIVGAAAVSVSGLVVLGVVYATHKTTPVVAPVVDATPPAVIDTTPVVPPPLPVVVDVIVDAAMVPEASAPLDAGRPRDAGADGGKKKIKPRVKHR